MRRTLGKLGIYSSRRGTRYTSHVAKIAADKGFEAAVLGDFPGRGAEDLDAVVVVGTDRDILDLLQMLERTSLPILGIGLPGYSGFLIEAGWEEADSALDKLSRGDYIVSKYARLEATVDDKAKIYALNEIAIFPSRSATLMEYSLYVDGEHVWHDIADGVLVSTPMGSTAYALSSGGCIVMAGAEVFEIVPVNSVDTSRRPIIVHDDSLIEIRDVSSRYSCEAIADGSRRIKVAERAVFKKGDAPALFISFHARTAKSIEKKLRLISELQEMPPSAKFVYKMLETEGPSTVKELASKTGLPQRTVRYALSILSKKGLVEKSANSWLRQVVYAAVKLS